MNKYEFLENYIYKKVILIKGICAAVFSILVRVPASHSRNAGMNPDWSGCV